MRQTFDVLVETVAVERLDRPDNPGVEGAPTLLQEAAVGHFIVRRQIERIPLPRPPRVRLPGSGSNGTERRGRPRPF